MLKKFISTLSLMLCAASLLTADLLYVVNPQFGTVNVVDTTTGQVTVISSVHMINPQNAAITPDGTMVFVTDEFSCYVNVIDTATNTVSASIFINDTTFGIAISPDGSFAYATNQVSSIGVVYAIDIATLTSISITDASLNEPNFVCFKPDSSTAYVTNGLGGLGTGSVSIIDVASHTVTGTVTDALGTFNEPLGINITPDGSMLYVANNGNDTVSVITTSNNTVTPSSAITDGSFDGVYYTIVSPDGSTCYITNNIINTVSKLSTSTNLVTGTITVGAYPNIMALGSGSSVYVTNSDGTVSAFDSVTSSVTGTFPGGRNPFGIAVLPTYSPTSLTGCLQKNVFLTQTDYVNVLNWSAPTNGFAPVSYNIYRDAALSDFVASVPANGPLQYLDHNLTKGQTYSYYVVSVYQNGGFSQPATVTVTQSCSKN